MVRSTKNFTGIINPATGEPFKQVEPDRNIYQLRKEILRALNLKYDAAQTTSQNELHWINADNLSPNAANSLAVRKTLRNRSRYEVFNNGYLKGILLTKSIDMVGSGATLQVTDKRFTKEGRLAIEQKWRMRAKRIKLRQKLRQLAFAKPSDGEVFSFAFQNSSSKHPIKLDQKIVECDQVSHYHINLNPKRGREIDGIRFNRISGEPSQYHLLNIHPGETQFSVLNPTDGVWHDARNVIHWFRKDRPWLRGIPETHTSLPLWALLRRYTLAVVQNAEIAADFTVLLKSLQPASVNQFLLDSSGEPSQTDSDDWFSSFPVDRGMLNVLPDGFDLTQLKPEQPVTVYDAFVAALVCEASRSLLMPKHRALGNSGEYNMSASVVDNIIYEGAIKDERYHCEEEVLDKDFDQWWFEASRIPGYFENSSVEESIRNNPSLREEGPEHCYRWDEIRKHSDPVKEAMAWDIMHRAGHVSDKDIQESKFNRPVEEHYENLDEQHKWRKEHGFLNEAIADTEIDLDELAQVEAETGKTNPRDGNVRPGRNGNGRQRQGQT